MTEKAVPGRRPAVADAGSWCRQCGMAHLRSTDCPGAPEPTGLERAVRALDVRRKNGTDRVSIVVAPAGSQFRARILTHPNRFWGVPGGGTSLKFLGNSPAEAVEEALAFVRHHCQAREVEIADDREASAGTTVAGAGQPVAIPDARLSQRHDRRFDLRFGCGKADRPGRTSNLSLGGLFIASDEHLLPEGSTVRVSIELGSFTVPLTGRVVWVRPQAGGGQQRGIGVQLTNTPAMYRRFIATLHREERLARDGEKGG